MRDGLRRGLARYKRPLRYLMGGLYVVAGVMHFVVPRVYVQVVPPLFPRPLELVYLSGVAEIVLGIGVLLPHRRARRLAAWGLMLFLVAVFPANVYMATHDVVLDGVPDWAREPSDLATWGRLPLQGVLILWAWWYTHPDTDG